MPQRRQQKEQAGTHHPEYVYCVSNNLLDHDAEGRGLVVAYLSGARDEYMFAELARRANAHRNAVVLGQVSPFKQPRLTRGDFILGHAWDSPGVVFRVPFDLLSGNCLAMSSSGGGKSWRSNFWFVQAVLLADFAWLIDLVKREGQRLVNAVARTGKRLIPVDFFELKFNVLQNPDPEAIDPRLWCAVVSDLIADAFDLPLGARALLQQHLVAAYTECGAMFGGRECITLRGLGQRIEQDKDANPQSRSALTQKILSFLAVTGDVTDYTLGWSAVDLMQFNLALSFGLLIRICGPVSVRAVLQARDIERFGSRPVS